MSQSVIKVELIHSYDKDTGTIDASCDVLTGVLRDGQILSSIDGPKIESIRKTPGGPEMHQANMSLGYWVVTLSNVKEDDVLALEGNRYRTYTLEDLKKSKYKKASSN